MTEAASDQQSGDTTPIVGVSSAEVTFRVKAGRGRRALLRAVDDVTLGIRPGETVALVGESGSGKSTLGRLVLGLMTPTAGSVSFDGQDLRSATAERRRAFRRSVQAVMQDTGSSLNPRRTILSSVEMPLRHNLGLRPREARARAAALLEAVGLRASTFALRSPLELSGGQRQRVAIARAMASGPRLIVADEAVSALDVSVRAHILQLMTNLQAQSGVSYLFITHDLGVVSAVADRVVVLYLGRIAEEGPAAALMHAPAHPYTRLLLASAPSTDPAGRPEPRDQPIGEIPSPVDMPGGCRFHPRCPLAADICRTVEPPVVRFADGLRTACHRATEIRSGPPDVG